MNHVGSSPQLETLNTNNINLHVGNLILKMNGVLPKPTKYAKGAQIFCLSPLHKRHQFELESNEDWDPKLPNTIKYNI